ncbi:P-loop containing nucleoside triphosphate hydrolase protein [Xylariaceae sp. FL0255]|nr:P-loop containing nucleoside triphosphate hydrolase protein [Xylariaceae sp. FL0255]
MYKNKEWQGYAAMTAAAYAKDLLLRIPLNKIEAENKERTTVSSAYNNNPGLQVRQSGRLTNAAFHLPLEFPETLPKLFFNVPFRCDDDFVERKTILDRIYYACSKPASRVALVGLGGEIWVFWVHAETRVRVEEGFKLIADALVCQWLQDERNGRCSNGSILVTTRNKDLACRLTGSYKHIVEVGPMDQEQAVSLLTKKVEDYTNTDAAARLYFEEFQRSERKRSNLLNRDFGDLRRDGSAKNSVITTWQISFDYIRSTRPSAADLLSLMSFFDRQGILELLILPPKQDRDSGADTDNESINKISNGFEMHGLSEKFKKQFISRMAQVFPTGRFENWEACQSLFPHAERAIDYRPEDEESQKDWALLLYNGSWFGREQGRYTISEEMARMSRDVYKTLLGPDHPSTLTSMANLASMYWNQGRWKEAESLEVQVMETRKTLLGPDHPSTLTSIANLASTYWNQGRWKEAESLEVQVMETRKTLLGPDHPSTLTSMANLASTYRNQGRWKEAKSLFVQVMETRKTVLGPDHPDTLNSMANLASTYRNQGRWKEAKSLFVQVMETRKTVLGPDHPDTLNSMANLASTYRNQGRWKEAKSLFVQVMETRKTVLGPDHPDTLNSINNLAFTWKSQGPEHPYTLSSLSAVNDWRTESVSSTS